MHYELGYRLKSEVVKHGRYSTPWFDFARVNTQDEANGILRRMEKDFPQAEFRPIQCFENTPERISYFDKLCKQAETRGAKAAYNEQSKGIRKA